MHRILCNPCGIYPHPASDTPPPLRRGILVDRPRPEKAVRRDAGRHQIICHDLLLHRHNLLLASSVNRAVSTGVRPQSYEFRVCAGPVRSSRQRSLIEQRIYAQIRIQLALAVVEGPDIESPRTLGCPTPFRGADDRPPPADI